MNQLIMHLLHTDNSLLPGFWKSIQKSKGNAHMPSQDIYDSLLQSKGAFLFCQDEVEMERQEGRSLTWFLFISGVLWQSAELLFYAVRLCRPCQDSLQTTHFLFRKCVLNGFSVWSFLWIRFLCCACFGFISFGIWQKRSCEWRLFSFMYFSLNTGETGHELIMTPGETSA